MVIKHLKNLKKNKQLAPIVLLFSSKEYMQLVIVAQKVLQTLKLDSESRKLSFQKLDSVSNAYKLLKISIELVYGLKLKLGEVWPLLNLALSQLKETTELAGLLIHQSLEIQNKLAEGLEGIKIHLPTTPNYFLLGYSLLYLLTTLITRSLKIRIVYFPSQRL